MVAQWSASPLELQHSGMRFLIDENLSPVLADLARERGYEAMAVRDLGLLNAKDWTLLEIVRRDDWILVTNNVEEFRRRYARRVELHAGVVFLIGVDAGRDVQKAAWGAALHLVATVNNLINQELCVAPDADGQWRVKVTPLP